MEITDLQERIRVMFGKEDKQSGPLFLTSVLAEETGELAKAARGRGNIEEEVADVLFTTISIANLFDIDITEAMEKKYLSRTKDEISGSWTDVDWNARDESRSDH